MESMREIRRCVPPKERKKNQRDMKSMMTNPDAKTEKSRSCRLVIDRGNIFFAISGRTRNR